MNCVVHKTYPIARFQIANYPMFLSDLAKAFKIQMKRTLKTFMEILVNIQKFIIHMDEYSKSFKLKCENWFMLPNYIL